MIKGLPKTLKGILVVLLILANTLFFFPFLMIGALFKLVVPSEYLTKKGTEFCIGIATLWVSFNSALFDFFHPIKWTIKGTENLNPEDWYLVNCNHQSWADIPIIQKVMLRKVPMLKFFLKKQLIWVPLLGLCWWALDFPFMKRSSPAEIKKNPSLAGKDLETTRIACEKFKTTPVSVFNFLEGTRFTEEKHTTQASPYEHLLKPKAGGAAFVIGSMGTTMRRMLDVTIYYPEGRQGIWQLCRGDMLEIEVYVEDIEIPEAFLGKDYMSDPEFKSAFQAWVNDLWSKKNEFLKTLHNRP